MTQNNTEQRTVIAQVEVAGETVTACGPTRALALTHLSQGVEAHCERAGVTLPVPFGALLGEGDVTIFSFGQRGGYISNLLDNTEAAAVDSSGWTKEG